MYFKDITEGGFCQEKSEHMFDLADEWYRTTKQNRILWKGKHVMYFLLNIIFCSAKVDGEAVVPCSGHDAVYLTGMRVQSLRGMAEEKMGTIKENPRRR
ncbi:MAG: hypothetical protein ACLTW9_11820 [Enterocloster sp.]